MSVYFHSSFNLNLERLAGVLKYIITQPELGDEQIATQFGYRAPFTKRYKSWLKKCGILENSLKVKLTEYGKIIYENDSELIKEISLWYMHSFLTHSEDNAEVWNYFYYYFLPKNKSFTKEELSEGLSMKLMVHNPSHFKKNAPMIKVITKVLVDSYTSTTAFGPLEILKFKNGRFFQVEKESPYNWTNVESFAKLY